MSIAGAVAARVRDRASMVSGASFNRPPDVHADFQHGVYRFGGSRFSTADALMGAIGGVRNGAAYDIGPAVVGAELVSNGTFDANITGWSMVGGLGTATLSQQPPGVLRMAAPGAGQQRVGQAQNRVADKVYRARATCVTNGGFPQLSEHGPGGATTTSSAAHVTNPMEIVWADHSGGSRTLALNSNFASAVYDEFDDVSMVEVRPFAAFDYTAWAALIRGTAPAALPGTEQVIYAADTDNAGKATGQDRDRVRLAWATNGDLKLIVTRLNVEQVNMVIGSLAAGADFSVRLSIGANDVIASLNGAPGVVDTSCSPPGLAYMRLGRSRSGEAFGGVIHEAGIWFGYQAIAPDPLKVFKINGDSTAFGSGAVTPWFLRLANGYAPARVYVNDGVGGQGIGTMRDRMVADPRRRDWPTFLYDRKNTGETLVSYMAALTEAVNLLTGRFFIFPQVPYSDGLEDPTNWAVMQSINAAIRAAWPNNTFSEAEETAFLAALSPGSTRSDTLHRNDVGAEIEKTYLRAWLDAKGW